MKQKVMKKKVPVESRVIFFIDLILMKIKHEISNLQINCICIWSMYSANQFSDNLYNGVMNGRFTFSGEPAML